jgi:hypothetical protein
MTAWDRMNILNDDVGRKNRDLLGHFAFPPAKFLGGHPSKPRTESGDCRNAMFADKTAVARNTANNSWIPTSAMRLDSIPRTFLRIKWE